MTILKALEVFFSHKKKLKEAQGKLLWQEKSNKESFTSSFLPRTVNLLLGREKKFVGWIGDFSV